MEKISVQPHDRLIFLGDYVDGWSQSAQVIEYLEALEKKTPVFLSGATMMPGVRPGWVGMWPIRNGCCMVVCKR